MKYLFGAFLALGLGTFYHRINHYDEAWLAEQAYWLVSDGRVRSELFRGLNGWENQLFVFHKGFIYLSAGWQRAIGFSLVAGKSFSLLWATATGWLLAGYLRQQRIEARFVWLGLLLYVAHGVVVDFSFIYRPEAMYTTLGFGSFWLLTQRRWAWAGALAGLATFTHLNGLCFVTAGVGWLVWYRHGRQALYFSLLAGSVASLYWLDVYLSDGWSTWQFQWRNDPALAHINSLTDKLLASAKVISLLHIALELWLIVVGTCWLTRRAQPRAQPIGRYSLLLLATYLLISRSNSVHYVLPFVPFGCAYVALRIADWQQNQQPARAVWLWRGLLTSYLLISVGRLSLSYHRNGSSPGVTALNAQMAALIGQRGSRVIAPLDFFYEQIGHYRIRGVDQYLDSFFTPATQQPLTRGQLFAMAEHDGFAAVITYDGKGPNALTTDTHPLPDSLAQFGLFHRIYQDQWNSLYVRKNW